MIDGIVDKTGVMIQSPTYNFNGVRDGGRGLPYSVSSSGTSIYNRYTSELYGVHPVVILILT